jgi:hypothetical protein
MDVRRENTDVREVDSLSAEYLKLRYLTFGEAAFESCPFFFQNIRNAFKKAPVHIAPSTSGIAGTSCVT